MLSGADCLILDEPNNHLDRPNRQALIEQLQRWPRGPIVASHDRQLLEAMERIVELSPLELHSYGGNYTFYAQAKTHEQQAALDQLSQQKLERQREERAMRKQHERQEKRQARGNRLGKEANQTKILLERLKGALACILYADSPPQLLLLDEPNNHLDLPSAQALETMLRSYQGALVVVSHDDAFLENLALTDRLLATEQGWHLEPVL
ncbi:hypothetical protein ACM25P_15405 [Vreelandella alkaliphila]|uniref:hypothetical protein n=1 Tax=Vreelandella alkaliphila TaxID=272774 RepID=UPI00232AD7F9|nr:hypothetical protein [Halomonas alkaliphila]